MQQKEENEAAVKFQANLASLFQNNDENNFFGDVQMSMLTHNNMLNA